MVMADESFAMKVMISTALAGFKQTAFINRTVGDILWGYKDPFLDFVNTVKPGLLPFKDKFGLLVQVGERLWRILDPGASDGQREAWNNGGKNQDGCELVSVSGFQRQRCILYGYQNNAAGGPDAAHNSLRSLQTSGLSGNLRLFEGRSPQPSLHTPDVSRDLLVLSNPIHIRKKVRE